MNRLYPIHHQLSDRLVVIVGGGAVARRRVERLLLSGARVRIVSPELCEQLRALHETGRLQWIAREYERGDLDGAEFVFVACELPRGDGDASLEALLGEVATSGALLNYAPDASLSHFHVPATLERGSLTLAVSSEGSSPAWTRRLRTDLERWLDTIDTHALEKLRAARRATQAVDPSSEAGRQQCREIADATPLHRPRAEARDRRPTGGTVYLVGAGPGDPELLTLRAARLLEAADVVYYDRLVSAEILDTLSDDVERVYVGKSVGCTRRVDAIDLMVRSAREGRVVVRLKGGDPVLFGRGAEEMLALRAQAVPYELVPGIPAASAVPAAAGIPITSRDLAGEVIIRSGHRRDDGAPTRSCAQAKTWVYFMAVRRLQDVVEELLAEGLERDTPVAVIENGTRPEQRVITGDLETIVGLTQEAAVTAPALVVVGDVVHFGRLLDPQIAPAATAESTP